MHFILLSLHTWTSASLSLVLSLKLIPLTFLQKSTIFPPFRLPGYREGYLWKRGRDNGQYLSRKFILSEREGVLKYFNKHDVNTKFPPLSLSFSPLFIRSLCNSFQMFSSQAREPKAIMKIDSLNATFQPSKIGTAHGLQITYLKDNSTRNIFVYHEDGKVWRTSVLRLQRALCLPLVEHLRHYKALLLSNMNSYFPLSAISVGISKILSTFFPPQETVDWFNAIRGARFHYLQVAFPGAATSEVSMCTCALTRFLTQPHSHTRSTYSSCERRAEDTSACFCGYYTGACV